MTHPDARVSDIAAVCGGTTEPAHAGDTVVRDLLIDSRRLIHPDHCLFIALVTERNDGHRYIGELYRKGVRLFLVSRETGLPGPDAVFIRVTDTLAALQQIGLWHRRRFTIPVIGITGSNGKTIVKEWLFQLLSGEYTIIRSPKSYNSQTGVPLSVWKMASGNDLAIFEAGISQPGEMECLSYIINPTLGIFTNVGTAHDEHFTGHRQKVREKLKLFAAAETLVYASKYSLITECLDEDPVYRRVRRFTWGTAESDNLQVEKLTAGEGSTRIETVCRGERLTIDIPFTDDASVENALHCLAAMLVLKEFRTGDVTERFPRLVPVAMRLELREAVNHCSLINDSYNSDVNSLSIALDFLEQQNQHPKKSVILSDLLQTGRDKEELYREIAGMFTSRGIHRVIGIGRDLVRYGSVFPMEKAFFLTTDEFISRFPVSSFQNETILLKGARLFEFEKISQLLQQKAHETVMEINLDALIHNLNHYRSALKPGTRTMAMVKAFSYGSGSYEIANVLQFHRVDYLAVAYADEGVELRKAGIHLPVMVMSPEERSLDTLLKYNLEPEIYNLHILRLLEEAIERNQTSIQEEVRIHIKLDTGMHRLGFDGEETEGLIGRLKENPKLRVQSVFSHLAASEDPAEDDFTRLQIARFESMSAAIGEALQYPVLRHILNSAGISRFPEAQFDMVRLGIGLYGVGSSPEEQEKLRNVSTLKSVITQMRRVPAGETVGYNRKDRADHDRLIAVIPVGYADGLDRRLGNGRGRFYIHGWPVPIVGNICMDLTMADVTSLGATGIPPAEIGTEVVLFSDEHPVTELARAMETIPYEVLTGISRRVKRIYFYE